MNDVSRRHEAGDQGLDKGAEIVEEITTEAVTWSSILYEPSMLVLILAVLIALASGFWFVFS